MTASQLHHDVDQLVSALAGWQLPGEQPLNGVADPELGAALVARAVEERLIGVLAVAVSSGAMAVDDATSQAIADAHRAALVWCLRLEVELLRLVDLLGGVGVSPLVVKGPSVAHLDEADPSLRPFADLDLLVPGADVDATVAAITADGASRSWAERRPGFDRRFAKSVTLRYPDGLEVDLHRTLVDGVFGHRIPLEDLVARRVPLVLGGTTVWCLAPEHRVLHAAYHLALGSPTPRLMSVRDFAGYLVSANPTQEQVVEEARRWRGEAVLADAVLRTQAMVGVDAPAWVTWAERFEPAPGERDRLERHRHEGSGMGPAKLDALRELPRWRDRAAYGLALALPSRAHLRSRGLRRRDLVRPR